MSLWQRLLRVQGLLWLRNCAFVCLILQAATGGALAQPADVRQALPDAQLAGSSHFTFFGFSVYDARLWVAPGFRASEFASHALVLELSYLRDFTSEDIARQSLKEMRRAGNVSAAQATQWQRALQAALPDIGKGDRIAGIYSPGRGAAFLTNGKPTGEIRDAEFARLFFGIWLSPQTSEPALRRDLLAQAAP